MLPMLRDGEDVVVLKGTGGKRLRLFDVPLYRRDNGQYVLHRVLDFCRDGLQWSRRQPPARWPSP